ncbi:MAG: serine/threonine-protein kinase [Pseudomonadota bacterium]
MSDDKKNKIQATEPLSDATQRLQPTVPLKDSNEHLQPTEALSPDQQATEALATQALADKELPKSRDGQATQAVDASELLQGKVSDLPVGTVIRERFRILKVLGSGGMGTVYKATDLLKEEAHDRDTSIALKVLKPGIVDADMTFMALQREARRAQQLAHPNIVTVYDFDRADDVIFMTMEFMNGRGLDQCLEDGALEIAEVRRITREVGKGLAYAHKRGIVHSGLKPENVFVLEDGRVKILDFGIARAFQSEQRDFVEDAVAGCTPAYASPEVMERQQADPADDVYALACVVSQMASGEHPYQWHSGLEARKKNLKVKRPATLNRREWRAVRDGLALKRDQRPQDADVFLKRFLPSTVKATAWVVAVLAVVGAVVFNWVYQPEPGPDVPFEDLPMELQIEVRESLDGARAFLDQGDINTALQLFDEALRNHPGNLEGVAGMTETVNLALARIEAAVESGQINAESHRVTLRQLLAFETLPVEVRENLQAELDRLR